MHFSTIPPSGRKAARRYHPIGIGLRAKIGGCVGVQPEWRAGHRPRSRAQRAAPPADGPAAGPRSRPDRRPASKSAQQRWRSAPSGLSSILLCFGPAGVPPTYGHLLGKLAIYPPHMGDRPCSPSKKLRLTNH